MFIHLNCRTVTADLTDEQTLPIFAKCLQALPRLSTIQITFVRWQLLTHMSLAFNSTITLPTVQNLVMPSVAFNIVNCCPNVETITFNRPWDDTEFMKAIGTIECHSRLRALRNMSLKSSNLPCELIVVRSPNPRSSTCFISTAIAKFAPNLKEIEIWHLECDKLHVNHDEVGIECHKLWFQDLLDLFGELHDIKIPFLIQDNTMIDLFLVYIRCSLRKNAFHGHKVVTLQRTTWERVAVDQRTIQTETP